MLSEGEGRGGEGELLLVLTNMYIAETTKNKYVAGLGDTRVRGLPGINNRQSIVK